MGGRDCGVINFFFFFFFDFLARFGSRDEENRLEELKKSCRLADQETHDLYRRRSDVQLELGRLERKMAAQQAKCGRYEAQKRSFDERSQNVNKFIKTQETALRLVNKVSDFLSIPFHIFFSLSSIARRFISFCRHQRHLSA